MHSARWLKYCLGGEVVAKNGTASTVTTTLSGAHEAGQAYVNLAAGTNAAVGRYIIIEDDTAVPVVTTHEADGGTWDKTFTDLGFSIRLSRMK